MALDGKVALVTGAAGKGMGRSIALTLAREGAAVIVNYRRSRDSAEQIVSHIRSRGGKAEAVQADIVQPADCRGAVQAAVQSFGRLDICVIGPGCDWRPAPIEQLDPAAATEDVVNEVAPFYNLMPPALAAMSTNKSGRIVGLCLNPNHLPPAYSYNAAKAARTEAMMLAQDQAWNLGVTVNVIAPGPVTEVRDFDQAVELCDHGPAWAKRTGVTPQDIAEGVAFLCSESAGYISGGMLPYRW